MPPQPLTTGYVFRRGRLIARDFTPRPVKDTVGRLGQLPGLSAFETGSTGKRVHKIDVSRLQSPLRAFADDPAAGGTAGHVSIVPVDSNGNVDQVLLEEWAAAHDSGTIHPLTQNVLDSIVP
jgi:hypothetical protein